MVFLYTIAAETESGFIVHAVKTSYQNSEKFQLPCPFTIPDRIIIL
jgi:hypothetical protein